MRRGHLIAIVAGLSLAAPAAASADTFCVQAPACSGTPIPKFEDALTAAEADASPDRIALGAGNFVAPTTNGFNAPSNPVEIVGAGYATSLTGPVNSHHVLSVGDPGSSVSNLAIGIPQNSDVFAKYGLRLTGGGSARHIWVTGSPALTTAAFGVELFPGAVLEGSSIDLPANPHTTGVAARGDNVIRDNSVTAHFGILAQGPHVHIDRNRLTVTSSGINVNNQNIEATNTLIRLTGDSTGVYVGTGGSDAGITLRNVTILGDGSVDSFGVYGSSFNGRNVTVTVDSSIVRGVDYSLDRYATSTGTVSIHALYSDYERSRVAEHGPGAVTEGPGNIDADPLFVLGFYPSLGSPAIDSGNPADFADTLDLDREPRAADGNGTCTPRRDMGAFELNGQPSPACATPPAPAEPPVTPPPPAALDRTAPAITGLTLSPKRFAVSSRKTAISARTRRGTRFGFRLSETADVSIVIQRRNAGRYRRVGTLKRHLSAGTRRVAFSGRIGSRALRPGSYRALVTARDAAGNRSGTYRVSFRIVR